MCQTEYLTSRVGLVGGGIKCPQQVMAAEHYKGAMNCDHKLSLLLSPSNLAAVTTPRPTKARVWIGSHWFGIFFHWVSVPMVTTIVSIRDAVWCLILTLFLLSFCCFAFSRLWPHVPTISHLAPTPTNNLPPWNKCWHAHSFTYYISPNDVAT